MTAPFLIDIKVVLFIIITELETLLKRHTPVRCVFLCDSFFDLVLCKIYLGVRRIY